VVRRRVELINPRWYRRKRGAVALDAMNSTIDYYNKHADRFRRDTEGLDLSQLYAGFLELIPEGGRILDAGCGPGRDSLQFINRGYEVVAFDASERMAEIATKTIGQPALRLSFEEMAFRNEFDGVWACASLLHVPDSELESVLARIVRALKENGVLYMSFKYGTGERVAGGRRFTDMTEASIRETLSDLPELALLRTWRTSDLRPGRESESWLNALARKTRV